MNPNPITVLCFDIVRDVFSNFDRNTLYRMQIVNKRFNLIIENEFNDRPPYLFVRYLEYSDGQWAIKIETDSKVKVNLAVIRKIIASKFIRFKYFHASCDDNFHPMQLSSMSHVWESGKLNIQWKRIQSFRPTAEFHSFFANCSELMAIGSGAISMIHEIHSGRYRDLKLMDKDCDTLSQEIPWAKVMDFLFRPVKSSNLHNSISIFTERPPNLEKIMEFIDLVKERFEAADVVLNFAFEWRAKFEKNFPEFDIQNNQTKWRLKLYNISRGFWFYSSNKEPC